MSEKPLQQLAEASGCTKSSHFSHSPLLSSRKSKQKVKQNRKETREVSVEFSIPPKEGSSPRGGLKKDRRFGEEGGLFEISRSRRVMMIYYTLFLAE